MRSIEPARLAFHNMREDIVDPFLLQGGFRRAKTSDIYKKKTAGSAHEIWFEPDFIEPSLGTVDMAIDPIFRWKLPAITAKVLELTANDTFLIGGVPDLVVAQPIRLFVVGNKDLRWRAHSREEYRSAGLSICELIGNNIFPFIDSMKNIDDLIQLYETNDPRIIKQQHRYVFITAAYLLKNEFEKGKAVMEEHLGRPGLRNQYAAVFKHLNEIAPR